MTPDPIGLEGGFNLYAYTDNNPINHVDRYGLMVSYLVTLLKKGGEKVVRKLSRKEAIRARRKAINIVSDTKDEALRVEKAARHGDIRSIKRDKGHPQDDGSVGFSHYQTKGVRGHSAWFGSKGKLLGIVGAVITFLDPEEAIGGKLVGEGDEDYEKRMIEQFKIYDPERNCY